MHRTNFFVAIAIICSLLLCYEYIWLPIWLLEEKDEKANVQNVSRIKPVSVVQIVSRPRTKRFFLKAWSKDTPIVFLHIGKSGGTSFDSVIPPILGGLAKRGIPNIYVGRMHFDWSWIQERYPNGNVATIFRAPVSRMVSHFYFARTLEFTRNNPIRTQSLSEFLNGDLSNLMFNRFLWQDGEAAGMWLSGTHVSGWKDGKWLQNWVQYGNRKPSRDKVELFNIDFKSIVTEAADKIDTMFWFGIMEDLERSLELLAFQLGYEKKINFVRLRKTPRHIPPTTDDIQRISSLMPHDIWIYNYARAVFNARWQYYKSGKYVAPLRPPIPTESTCISTSFLLKCTSGPYSGITWAQANTPDEHLELFAKYFH